MDSNARNFLVKQKCIELMAFTSLEVRFLVDSSCSSKGLTNAIVMMVVFLRLDPALE